ncbi:MAG: 5'/3'-nucleotidase SurE [Clostridia bacterium]|nr:5'/3'-nucleotidase SurE [Clostridia bacterium]
MRILVTNDDGIDSLNIIRLVEALGDKHEVYCFAPCAQRSACSLSLTVGKQIEIREATMRGAQKAYSVNGTPADCVLLAIGYFDLRFDLVISGINMGANLAYDVMYSGTVAGAYEGVIKGVPSIALSQVGRGCDCGNLIDFFVENLEEFCKLTSKAYVLNINYPRGNAIGVRVCEMGTVKYSDEFSVSNTDGLRCGLVPDSPQISTSGDDSDVVLAEKGYVTITPLVVNRTDRTALERLKNIGHGIKLAEGV